MNFFRNESKTLIYYTNNKISLLIKFVLFTLLSLFFISCESDRKYNGQGDSQNEFVIENSKNNKKKNKAQIITKDSLIIKENILKNLLDSNLGIYVLDGIKGQAGANAEYETFKDEKGFWYASGSSISGVSGGADSRLNKKEMMILNNTKLEIDSNYRVSLSIFKNEVFSFDFNNFKDTISENLVEKLNYKITSKLEDIKNPIDNDLELNDTIITYKNEHIIYLKDNIEFDKLFPSDCGISDLEHVAMLTYNKLDNNFNLIIFDPNDRARFRLKFKKR